MSDYIFSANVLTRVPKLIKRPWWKIFGSDKIEMKPFVVRKAVHLSKSEVEMVFGDTAGGANLMNDKPANKLFFKLFCDCESGDLSQVQLEEVHSVAST